MTSIRRWLLGWLIFGLAATSLAAAYGIFQTARREAGELFDYELRTVALSLPANIATADAAERANHDLSGLGPCTKRATWAPAQAVSSLAAAPVW